MDNLQQNNNSDENENENKTNDNYDINIHQKIKQKLKYFYDRHKIPNIVFNGSSGTGKSKIINDFIKLIYNNNKEKINDYVMFVNCANGKGIKFIREELKQFAKTHINTNDGNNFKSIVLFNGDKLTLDAQSALRRCIELFCHNTRFFILVEDKNKLLKPILSRFCEIFVPDIEIGNLYKYNIKNIFNIDDVNDLRLNELKTMFNNFNFNDTTQTNLMNFILDVYEKGYSGLDIIKLIESEDLCKNNLRKNEVLILFNKIKKEIRDEKIIIFVIINFYFLDEMFELENI